MQDGKQAHEASQIDDKDRNNAVSGKGITLWNYGPERRRGRTSVGFNVYLRRVRETATDRLHGLLNRVKRQRL